MSLFDCPCSSSSSTSVCRGVKPSAAAELRGLAGIEGRTGFGPNAPTMVVLSGDAVQLRTKRHRRDVDPAGHHHAQRLEQDLVARPLRNESHRAEVDRARNVVVRVGGGNDDDRERGIRGSQLFEQLEAAAVAKLEIEQHDVVAGVLGQELAGAPRSLDADDSDVVTETLDDDLEPGENQRVIVDQQCFHWNLLGCSKTNETPAGKANRRR